MKRYTCICCLFLGLIAMLASCEMKQDLTGKIKVPGTDSIIDRNLMGVINLKLDPQKEKAVIGNTTKATDDALDVNDFEVQVLDEEGNAVKKFDSYADIDELLLPAGNYQIVAAKGDLKEAGFDNPYYKGEKQCVVNPKEVAEVVTPCVLENKKISLLFSEEFKARFSGDYDIILTNGQGVLTAHSGEQRTPYFKTTDQLDFTLHATTTEGLDVNYYCNLYNDPQVKEYNNVVVSLDVVSGNDPVDPDDPDTPDTPDGGTGEAERPLIKVDVSLVEKEYTIVIPSDFVSGGGDEDPSASKPTIVGVIPADITKPYTVDANSKVQVDITASEGLKGLIVKIESATLAPLLPAVGGDTFDMLNLTEVQKNLFSEMKLPSKGQKTTTRFDVSGFMELLESFSGTHKFHITATDMKNEKIEATLTLVVK